MAEERDDLVLRLLREIRETQHEQGRDLKALRKTVEEWQETTATMTGFAVHANTRHDAVSRDIEDLKARVEALEHAR